MTRLLYKILEAEEWEKFQKEGRTMGAAVDLHDGFIHFSYADQVEQTARKHFANKENLVLLAVSSHGFGSELRDEISRGGAFFPHLYGPLFIRNIIWTRKIPLDEAGIPVLGVLSHML